ncbi:MAG: hypothetical protein K6E58_01150 [Eubacterium sp.]|nr:hypothetical protein [Eubacterium sp.]
MKSTYKLIGTFWNRRKIPNKKPVLITDRRTLKSKHTISLTHLLKKTDKENLLLYSDNEYRVLNIDYIPNKNNKVEEDFYTKRLLQIIEYLSRNGELKLYVNKSDEKRVNLLLDSFYKRKTLPKCEAN